MDRNGRFTAVCVVFSALLVSSSSAEALVRTRDIANRAVTTAKIADGAVTAAKLAEGAVTPVKLAFYARVVIVAPSGGDFTDPKAAVDAITDAAADNRYLVKIMPGRYTVASSLMMKPYVDIEGSGANLTEVASGVSCLGVSGATVHTADNAELRFLTVSATSAVPAGEDGCVTAIGAYGTAPSIHHVTALATAFSGQRAQALYCGSCSASIADSLFVAEASQAKGITVQGGSPAIRDVRTVARGLGGALDDVYGIHVRSGTNPPTPTLTHVEASASGGGKQNYGMEMSDLPNRPALVSALDSTFTGTGGARSTGIHFWNIAADLDNVTAIGKDGDTACGLDLETGVHVNAVDSSFLASGATAHGIKSSGASLTGASVLARGEGSSLGVGVLVEGTSPDNWSFDRSTLSGGNYSLSVAAGSTVMVGASKLEGEREVLGASIDDPANGTYSCIMNYFWDYVTALGSRCEIP